MIHKRPEDNIRDLIKAQKSIRTTRLKNLVEPILEKVAWQEEALQRNVQTIRSLNDRAQRAEERLKEERRKVSDMELSMRIVKSWSEEKS
ncbi:hypothetical protein SLU01_19170 [Sporosarcina luteola]|uniref:Uncharacterized protein n=1 Tax=Sporosarcina luteola TaxID=582850 RepID=A0A511Z834_9BACL|nr:hypothetical protein SLU01_19170 [Sporosarcina luteola]